ncbi:MAG: energy transducer TonB [Sulfurovum sp.]|uniref:energy transducer TonB n=1 Tax=Sulfurovum sp. TaxID=1969726 RepID=UPI0028682D0B|nr:TonB family protein [Sulfurovum sp.]MCO4846185.1 energy transducer TonB [Sulfurovum sp.]
MLKHRHFISYFSTTLMYLLMAGIYFYAQNNTFVAAQKSEEKIMRMVLTAFVPEVATPVEQVEQVEEVEEPIIEEEPVVEEEPVIEEKPVVEPEIIKEPIPEKEPEVKEEIIPEPIVVKEIPKPIVKEVKKKPKPKKKTKKKKVKKKQQSQKASARRSNSSPAEKNQFLANIRAKINKHKSYPRIAKKRGMQGSIKVKFTILSSGKVGNISVSGPKVFHNSARNAVKSAFPVNAKNAPISLPKSINITLRYQLR